MTTTKQRLSPTQRLVLGIGVIALAVFMLLGGVFAAFTGTVSSATQSIGTGALSLALDPASGSSLANYTQTISGMAPGDVNNRFVNLRNSSTTPVTSGTLTITDAPGTTLLATNATNGLQVRVDRCSVAWTLPAGTCGGTTTTVVAQQSLSSLGTAKAITGLTLAGGESWYLRVTNTLPSTADNTYANLTEALTYKFDASQ